MALRHPVFRIARPGDASRFLALLATITTIAALAVAPARAAARAADPATALLLEQVRRLQHAGEVSGTVLAVREGFLTGRDTLRGAFEWGADGRTLVLAGPDTRFEWWSRERGGGREQWLRSGDGGRPRRLPPHAWHKPAFSPDVTFGDLDRLPFGFLDAVRVRQGRRVDDTTAAVEFAPPAELELPYAAMDGEFSGRPPLLRRIGFRGHSGRPSRTLEFTRYVALAGGMLPVEMIFHSGDGLTRTRMVFTPAPSGAARDRARAELPAPPAFAVPRWESRDGRDARVPSP